LLTVKKGWEVTMDQVLINLIAGALGGVGAGKSSPTFDLGMIGNIIAGLVDAVARCVGIRCGAISNEMKLSFQAARSIG
jgi:uncharacterized membrane protein YeaQ/YmgE (transglycosylase-associated protein family)